MTNTDPPPSEQTPWDLVGEYMNNLTAAASAIATRNLSLWRIPQGYDAADPERWRKDSERVASVAMENARDLWMATHWFSPRQRIAYPLPVVVLEFQPHGEHGDHWQLCEQTLIPIGLAGLTHLPDEADIEVHGGDPAGASALKRCLRAHLDSKRTGYLVETYDVKGLRPGFYTGTVSVDRDAPCPIAQLQIFVPGDARAEAAPTVAVRWVVAAPGTREWQPPGPIALGLWQGGPEPNGPIVVSLVGGEHAGPLAEGFEITTVPPGRSYELRLPARPPEGAAGYYTGVVRCRDSQPHVLARLEVIVDPTPPSSG